jgi:outer membrane immunogenic protein
MKYVLLACVAAVAITAASQSAVAADMPVRAPVMKAAPVAAVFSWSGAYAGLNGGWGLSRSPNSYSEGGGWIPEENVDGDGWLGGGHIGFNWQSGAYVGGAEADILATGIKGDDRDIGGATNEMALPWIATFRLRGGYAVDRTLFFVTGGAALAKIESNVLDTSGDDQSKNQWGWTVGAGIEHAYANSWTGRLEYRYIDFGSPEFQHAGYIERFNSVKTHLFLAGISYRW